MARRLECQVPGGGIGDLATIVAIIALNIITVAMFLLQGRLASMHLWQSVCYTLWGQYMAGVLDVIRMVASFVIIVVVLILAILAIRCQALWIFISCDDANVVAKMASVAQAALSTSPQTWATFWSTPPRLPKHTCNMYSPRAPHRPK